MLADPLIYFLGAISGVVMVNFWTSKSLALRLLLVAVSVACLYAAMAASTSPALRHAYTEQR